MDKTEASGRSQPSSLQSFPHGEKRLLGHLGEYPVNQASAELLCSPTWPFSASVCPICEMGKCTEDWSNVGFASLCRTAERASSVVWGRSCCKGERLHTSWLRLLKRIRVCGHEVMGFRASNPDSAAS